VPTKEPLKFWALVTSVGLAVGSASCAHAPRTSGAPARPESSSVALGPDRCESPSGSIEATVASLGVFHAPAPDGPAAWARRLGLDLNVKKASASERARLRELATHLGPADSATVTDEELTALRQGWDEPVGLDQFLLHHTHTIHVCGDELDYAAARLHLEDVLTESDRGNVAEVAGSLLLNWGGLDAVPDPVWHGAWHSLEYLMLGATIRELFESPDDEIDSVDSNL
jgi:hypothetical protein